MSPEDLQSKLDHATRTPRLSAFDCSEGGAVYDGAIRKPEIDLIKNVEEFRAKLDSVAFLENEVFENCKIGAAVGRTTQDVSSSSAVLPQQGILDSERRAILLFNHLRIARLRNKTTAGVNKRARVEKPVDHAGPTLMI